MQRQREQPRARSRVIQEEEEEEEESSSEEIAETQSSQSTQQTRVDFKQPLDLRRRIRKEYRKLIDETQEYKHELVQPDSEGLQKALDKSDQLYSQVKMPREAALDSEFLTLAIQFGLEQTNRLKTGVQARDISDFIVKLRQKLLGTAINNDTEQQDLANDLDWVSLGGQSARHIKRTPSISFLNGPLGMLPPERKERKRKEREVVAAREAPELIKNVAELTPEELDKDTRRRVEVVKRHLDEKKKVNFLQFVVDPKSFSQTIENIFHYSFLIKDGQASLTIDNGQPYAAPEQPPLAEDYATGTADRKQMVLRVDYDMWKRVVEKYNMTEGLLPHREPTAHHHRANNNNNNVQSSQISQAGVLVEDLDEDNTQPARKGRNSSQKSSSQSAKKNSKPSKRRTNSSDDDGELDLSGEEEALSDRRKRLRR